jgi:RNA-binding protein
MRSPFKARLEAQMPLDKKTRKKYRSIGHHLDPVVIVANGLTENVQAEISRALSDHELIKVRIVSEDREDRKVLIGEICEYEKAELVQVIGKVALIYRKAVDQKQHLSNIRRFQESI